MSWFYKTSNPSKTQMPFLPSRPSLLASLPSYGLMWVLPSLSHSANRWLSPVRSRAGSQQLPALHRWTETLLSEMCQFGSDSVWLGHSANGTELQAEKSPHLSPSKGPSPKTQPLHRYEWDKNCLKGKYKQLRKLKDQEILCETAFEIPLWRVDNWPGKEWDTQRKPYWGHPWGQQFLRQAAGNKSSPVSSLRADGAGPAKYSGFLRRDGDLGGLCLLD